MACSPEWQSCWCQRLELGKGLCAKLALSSGGSERSVMAPDLWVLLKCHQCCPCSCHGSDNACTSRWVWRWRVAYASHYGSAWHIIGATEMVAAKAVLPFFSLLGHRSGVVCQQFSGGWGLQRVGEDQKLQQLYEWPDLHRAFSVWPLHRRVARDEAEQAWGPYCHQL